MFVYTLIVIAHKASASPFEVSWHRQFPLEPHLVEDRLLDHNYLFGLPVSLVPPEQSCNIIPASPVEWVSQLIITAFKVLVCRQVQRKNVLVITKEPENENAQECN